MNPQPHVHRPPYAPGRGRFYWWLGVCVITAGFLLAFAGGIPHPQNGTLLFTGIAVLLVGVKIWYRGKQYAATPGEEAESKDPRAPVVFLRSFSAEAEDKTLRHFSWNALFGRPLAVSIPPGSMYEREELKRLFEKVGPFLTVGRPGEPFADPGPARFYLPDEEWQAFVETRLRRARLVIVRAGLTPGLGWEVQQLVSIVRPNQILFFLPIDRKDYAPFQKWVSLLLPKPLPEIAPKADRLLTFDEHWNPVFLPTRGTLKQSFAPFFQQNGISLP